MASSAYCGSTLRARLFAAAFICPAILNGCGSSPPPPVPVDSTLDLFNNTARIEYDQGHPAEAAASYASALDRARQMDDPAAVTLAAYNLAIARAASADSAAALAALDEAMHEVGRTTLDPVDLWLVRAKVELLAGHPTAAAHWADAVLADPRSARPADRRAQAHVIKGQVDCRSSDGVAAARELAEARALASAAEGPAIPAMVAGLEGEVALLSKDPASAAAAFDRQAELARQAVDYRTMGRALAKAGRAYAAAGRQGLAADRLYRAARSAIAATDRDAAALTTAAAAAARLAGDPALVRLTELLSARLGATTRTVP